MRAATLIASKDLKLRVRDRSAFIVGIIAPLGLAFIFNLVLGGIAEGDFVPVFSITNLDQGTVGEGFVSVLDEIDAGGVIDIAERPGSLEAAEQLAEDGTVAAAIVIPAGFSEAVQSGGESSVVVVTNSDSPTSGEIARSIAAASLPRSVPPSLRWRPLPSRQGARSHRQRSVGSLRRLRQVFRR